MNKTAALFLILLVGGLSVALDTHAQSPAPPDSASSQAPGSQQDANTPQSPERGDGRPIPLFGKLTAIHEQSLDIESKGRLMKHAMETLDDSVMPRRVAAE